MSSFDIALTMTIQAPGFKADLRRLAENAIMLTAEEVIKPLAVELSPKLTGHNARTIQTEIIDHGSADKVGVTLFTTSGYGGYLEAGTRKMAARPYIYPAYLTGKSAFFSRIKALWGR